MRPLAVAFALGLSFAPAGLAASSGESPWVKESFSEARLVSGTVGGADKPELVAVHKEADNFKLELQKQAASPIPFHPGAVKYFNEKGVKIQ